MSKTQSTVNLKVIYRVIMLGALLAVTAGCDPPEKTRSRIECINNLKHVGMALVLYAHDHDNILPRDFSVIANSNYLDQPPSVFVCPGEKVRRTVETQNWSTFDLKNISYSLVAPGAHLEPSVTSDLVECLVHQQVAFIQGKTVRTRARTANQ